MTTRISYDIFERSELTKKHDAMILERVKKGMELLQEKYGDKWIDYIEPRSLHLSEGSCCVLGQVHAAQHGSEGDEGNYQNELDELGLEGDGYEYGFATKAETWDDLDSAWKDVFHALGI